MYHSPLAGEGTGEMCQSQPIKAANDSSVEQPIASVAR